MSQQYIQSPGVQINEVDLSLRVSSPTGVGVLAMGFTDQGPTDEVIQVTSIQEFESLYGQPTNAAERYSYHTIKALFDSPANIYFSRLPYGSDKGDIFTQDRYSALVYPVIPSLSSSDWSNLSSSGMDYDTELNSTDGFFIAQPYHIELTRGEYERIINGEIHWTKNLGRLSSLDAAVDNPDSDILPALGDAGLIVLNSGKTTINEQFEGHYLGISDNINTNPGSTYKDVVTINSINNTGDAGQDGYITVPDSRLDFTLSSNDNTKDSISVAMESIPSFNIGGDEFTDFLSIGLFKLRKTPFNNSEISLSYALTEAYLGSFDPYRELQSPTGGRNDSIFLENLDNVSNNVRFFVNPNLQEAFTMELQDNEDNIATPKRFVRVLSQDIITDVDTEYPNKPANLTTDLVANELYPIGVFQNRRGKDKAIGSVYQKVERVLDLVENPDLFELDIVVEGGLGTVFASTKELSSGEYDETKNWPSLDTLRTVSDRPVECETVDNYISMFNMFNGFCENQRKDCIFIADPIRQIFVTGENSRVLQQTYVKDEDRIPKTFNAFIYSSLKNQFSRVNSSYAVSYANWAKVFDGAANKQVWVPYSGFAASLMANMDYVWEAPAGLTRGINNNIVDLAIYPKQKERDQLYKISQNPVAFFPNEGFVTWGQKTLLRKPSAFDRINVRRVFLYLEKATMKTSKYFVFEANNLFLWTQVINVLSPLFEDVKNKAGIRDYILVVNEKNNTSQVIEQNQLKIDIYIKPTKVSEFILVDFMATRQDANFQELIGS